MPLQRLKMPARQVTLAHVPGTGSGKPRQASGVIEQVRGDARQVGGIAPAEPRAGAAPDNLAQTAGSRGQDGHAGSHSLDGREAERLIARGHDAEGRPPEQIGDILTMTEDVEAGLGGERGGQRAPADERETGARMPGADGRPRGRQDILPLASVDGADADQHGVVGRRAEGLAEPVGAATGGEGGGVDEIGEHRAARTQAHPEAPPSREGVGRDGEDAAMEPSVQLRMVRMEVGEAGDAVQELETGGEVARPGEVRMDKPDRLGAAEVGHPAKLAERPAREIRGKKGHLATGGLGNPGAGRRGEPDAVATGRQERRQPARVDDGAVATRVGGGNQHIHTTNLAIPKGLGNPRVARGRAGTKVDGMSLHRSLLLAAALPLALAAAPSFEDNFDGPEVDRAKWEVQEQPRKGAFNTARALTLKDGILRITTFTEEGRHFTGFLTSAKRFEQVQGRFEARIRFNTQPGMWSAFWSMPMTFGRSKDPAKADIDGLELDIVEHLHKFGGHYDTTIHWGGYGKPHQRTATHRNEPANPANKGFHTYAVEWDESGYRFFHDGRLTWQAPQHVPVSKAPQHLIVSSEVVEGGRGWAGIVPEGGYGPKATSAAWMEVDWVRAWPKPAKDPAR